MPPNNTDGSEDEEVDEDADETTEDEDTDDSAASDEEDESDSDDSKDETEEEDEDADGDDDAGDDNGKKDDKDKKPDPSKAAFHKANAWRKKYRALEAKIPALVQTALTQMGVKPDGAKKDPKYEEAVNTVIKVVAETFGIKPAAERQSEQQKMDQMVQDMIEECEEEFGDEFNAKEALEFAKKNGLSSLKTAYLWIQDRKKIKGETQKTTTKKLLKKKDANLAGGGHGKAAAHDYGVGEKDDLEDVKRKVIQNWKK